MSNPSPFQEALAASVLVFDGAMGTEIYRRHVFTNRCYDELCLSDPKLIRQIHREYADAGADVLTTNTFGANRASLAKYGLEDKVRRDQPPRARLAREVADAAGRTVFVAGSIGPHFEQPRRQAVAAMIVEQAAALREGGADFIIFETLSTRQAMQECAEAMRQLPEVPFILSAAIVGQDESASGEPIEAMLAPLPDDCPMPIAWGLNCGLGPDGLLGAVERAVKAVSLPLVVQPNAGVPKEVEYRRIYFCSPEYLTSYAKRFVGLGASAVGGCCGTTPEHIREIALAVKPLARRKTPVAAPAEPAAAKEPAPFAEKSRLSGRLAARAMGRHG